MQSNPTPKLTPNESMREDDNYRQKYDRIHTTIEDLNARLMDMFHKKELELLEEYKREMFRAQSELNELRDNTNEQELKRKMIEKKEQLQKERQTFLQASIQFSNRCEVFKHKLQRVVGETRDLESEIKFLNEQIDSANRKNLKLKEELEGLNTLDSNRALPRSNEANATSAAKMSLPSTQMKTIIKRKLGELQNSSANRYQPEDSVRRQQKASSTMKRNLSYNNAPTISTSRSDIKRTKEKAQRIREMLNDPIFQETDFERMFVESVKAVKDRKLLKKQSANDTNLKRLPSLKKHPTQPVVEDEQAPHNISGSALTRQFRISDGQLNEYDKRAIMEDFLSRDEVKQYLYKLIFKDAVESRRQKNQPPS